MALRPSPFGACHLSLIGLLASVGRLSMTTRTYTPSLSLSIATYSACDSVWLGDDAFLPLLLTFDDQSPATGQRSLPSTWEVGVDVSHEMCYHLTYLGTQLSRFSVVNDHPILAAHPPYHRYGFERTDRTKRMNPTLLFFELTNALRQRKSQTFHHSSARPARQVIRRAVGRQVTNKAAHRMKGEPK